MIRVLAPLLVLLLLGGCADDAATPPEDPRTVGTKAVLCAGRVDAERANGVVGNIATLVELNGFSVGTRTGQCTLEGVEGGAVLDIAVILDKGGLALEAELRELASTPNFSGDKTWAVAGEGPRTSAYRAIDATHYVRVIGLAGTSEEQRAAALDLTEEVAARSTGK